MFGPGRALARATEEAHRKPQSHDNIGDRSSKSSRSKRQSAFHFIASPCLRASVGEAFTLLPLQSKLSMPTFCDVALPVPLDMAFTYKIAEQQPVIGGRVLVPFRNDRLSGVVTALHDREPTVKTKTVLQVLDAEPVLDDALMQLGQWIAQYYLAPIGDVFRTMLPLAAEI